jgi:hypothetical protein
MKRRRAAPFVGVVFSSGADVGKVHLLEERLSFEMSAYSVAVIRAN